MGSLGDFRRFFIANIRIQCSDKHKRVLKVSFDGCFIDFDADETIADKGVAAIGDELDGVEDVADDEWFIDVELEVSVHAAEGYGQVVAHHLTAQH
jgi:hypothetical protein